jgi:hypothetical protein
MKKYSWNEIDERMCKDVALGYVAGDNSTVLSIRFNISVANVFRCLKKQGIKSRSQSEAKQKFHFDESYFKKIDSHEKAQILGMIAADGCVQNNRPVFEITLQRRDEEYVQHIKKCIKYDGPLNFSMKKTNKTKVALPYVRLAITSRVIKEDLVKLGMIPSKSLKLKFPTSEQVPDEFISSFVLGYLEGDGGINVCDGKTGMIANIKMCVTREFGETLSRLWKEKLDIGSCLTTPKTSRQHGVNMHNIGSGGSLQVMRLCEWMYRHATFRMKRKHDRYLHLLSYYDAEGNRIKESGWGRAFADRCKITHKKNGTWAGRAPKREAYFLSPENIVTKVTRISQFAREMGFAKHVIYGVSNKKKGHYSCKGWRLATPDQIAAARASNTLIEKIYDQPVPRPYAGLT